jgi:predicted metal-binding protein
VPEEIVGLSTGEILCSRVPLSKVIIEEGGGYCDEFFSYFNYAIIVTTSSQPDTIHEGKMLIRQILKLEKFIEESAHFAFSFYYPITCPFCLPADCREKEGKCMNPAYKRPFPKEFKINLSKTMENAKIRDLGLCTLILVK